MVNVLRNVAPAYDWYKKIYTVPGILRFLIWYVHIIQHAW